MCDAVSLNEAKSTLLIFMGILVQVFLNLRALSYEENIFVLWCIFYLYELDYQTLKVLLCMYNKNESAECEQHWVRSRVLVKPFTSIFTLGILHNNLWSPHLQNEENISAAHLTGFLREEIIYATMANLKQSMKGWTGSCGGCSVCTWHYHSLGDLCPITWPWFPHLSDEGNDNTNLTHLLRGLSKMLYKIPIIYDSG